MKKAKKVVALLLCAVLLVVGSVTGTMAYLTSQDTVVNTFTVGKVVITLDEAKVDEYGKPMRFDEDSQKYVYVTEVKDAKRVKINDYKLIPGHNYVKDPIVHVDENSEDSWLFVKVTNAITNIEDSVTIFNQMTASEGAKWVLISGDNTNGVYAYVDIVEANQNIPVFNEFTITGNADVDSYKDKTITVQAYAVQADGFETYTEAWNNAAPSEWTASTVSE